MKSKNPILITFDDGHIGVYTEAYPYMKQHNIPGTIYLETSKMDTEGYLTWDQCAEMANDGWIMGNHTRNHTRLGEHTRVEQKTDILAGISDLIDHGYTEGAYHFAFPGASYNYATWTLLRDVGMKTARLSWDQSTGNWNQPIPPQNWYRLNNILIGSYMGETVIEDLVTGILSCRTTLNANLISYHNIVTTPTVGEDNSITSFQAQINALIELNANFITIVDLYTKRFSPFRENVERPL